LVVASWELHIENKIPWEKRQPKIAVPEAGERKLPAILSVRETKVALTKRGSFGRILLS